MALGVDTMRPGRVMFKVAMLTLGTFGFVFCLALLSGAMRSVMDGGGSCASGGAYQIRQQCPQGVAWVAPVSIFGMPAFAGISFVGVFSKGGPKPYAFAWSALFLALGWNFLEYGFDPPGGGTSAGWLVCGFVFVAMGGAPLLLLFAPSAARWALWGPAREAPDSAPVPYRPPGQTAPPPQTAPLPPTAAAGGLVRHAPEPEPEPTAAAEAAPPMDVVGRLERLANLRDRGLLDANEYEIAKDKILHDEVGS